MIGHLNDNKILNLNILDQIGRITYSHTYIKVLTSLLDFDRISVSIPGIRKVRDMKGLFVVFVD